MDLSIDFTTIGDFGVRNPLFFSWLIFIKGGWIVFVILFFVGLFILHLEQAKNRYRKNINYVLLAIDVPKENEQSMKAVEQIFAQLAAVASLINLYQRYWQGKLQHSFSLELASIDGYIQYLIRAPEDHRDLVEAAIYAQYPDAEITEVDDYTKAIPNHFPNDQYDLWGTEFVLFKNQAYPIRTYMSFEHSLTQKFADPMASILEALSRLLPGEQVWLQLVITPAHFSWIKNAEHVVKKLIGEKIAKRKTILSPLTEVARSFSDEALKQITGEGIGATKTPEGREFPTKMQFLSPGDRNVVEAIENKISKIGFLTKFRVIYVAKKELFQKGRGVNPIQGGILQYNTQNLNGFMQHLKTRTRADYFFAKKRLALRKRKIIKYYKERSNYKGAGEGYILNIEELASIYHFPIAEITAPLVQKTEIRKGGPPPTLPREAMISEGVTAPEEKRIRPTPITAKERAPENLPIESDKNFYDQSSTK